MKNAVALGFGSRAVLSPHIGELDTPRARDVFAATIVDMQTLYSVDAARAAADSHPGYFGNRWVRGQRENAGFVPHHHAHASALAGENPDIGSWLVFTWDGVGLGPDGTLWGGEALLGRPGAWRRVASLRPLLLPGASRAGREPWRSAAAMMWAGGHDFDAPNDASGIARKAWSAGANCHETSAAGRVFDGAAALVFGLDAVSFEGEAPMRLEAIADMAAGPIELPLARGDDGIWRSDWAPLLPILSDRSLGIEKRAGAFHATMAAVIATQVRAVVAEHPFDAVGLTGGVFQNRKLAEAAIRNLAALDIAAHLPQTVPANDGGIAYGQLVELAARDQRNPT